jgi:hypothetical protein
MNQFTAPATRQAYAGSDPMKDLLPVAALLAAAAAAFVATVTANAASLF